MGSLRGNLLILGVAGKMGPTLARRARRAASAAGGGMRIVGVSRFSDGAVRRTLDRHGVETIAADLLDPDAVERLPDADNVIFMAGRKFGSAGAEWLTWATNACVPAWVARRYRTSKMVAFSSGNVYPLVPVTGGGATEETQPLPVGEYAQSVLARERIFEFYSSRYGTPVCLLRLNYAVEQRYGVLLDIGTRVWRGDPVNLAMGYLNAIWQGDANSVCLRSFALCQSPPAILNVTGAEVLGRRDGSRAAERHGINRRTSRRGMGGSEHRGYASSGSSLMRWTDSSSWSGEKGFGSSATRPAGSASNCRVSVSVQVEDGAPDVMMMRSFGEMRQQASATCRPLESEMATSAMSRSMRLRRCVNFSRASLAEVAGWTSNPAERRT